MPVERWVAPAVETGGRDRPARERRHSGMISRREASVNDRLRARKHFLLFGALLLTLVTQPLVAREPTAARIAYDLLIAGAALCVFFIVFGLRWERRLALVLMLPTIALTIAEYVLPQRHFVA